MSGDVIHPQLWESGSGYETSMYTCCDFALRLFAQGSYTVHCADNIVCI